MNKRAFTLIELLVVIAIIAILAAILFPVFAQAKDAAKKTQSLSNVKQIELSSIMYGGDYDDTAVIGIDFTWSAWTDKVQPYMKNWNMMWSPAGGPRVISSWMQPQYDWWANWRWFAQYGYNAVYLNLAKGDCSDMSANNMAFGPPVGLTAVANVAETVMFAEVGQDSPEDNVGTSLAYSPGGYTDPSSCTYWDWGNGGTDTGWFAAGGGRTDKTRMGFFRPRHSGGGVVSFVDGHAKHMKPGALAAGTDWNIDTSAPGNIYIIDRSKYIWDIW